MLRSTAALGHAARTTGFTANWLDGRHFPQDPDRWHRWHSHC
jgi:hypothetical protein